MATEIYLQVSYFFRLSLLIFTICGCEAVNSTLPCPVTNSTTGAILCCPAHESNTTHTPDEDEECVEILPITSASLLGEFWTIKEFNLARKERKNTSPHANDSIGTCCCKERVDFILPGMATTVSGSVSQILQNSPGYVQPVSARMCKEASCSRRTAGKKQISTCIQRWTAADLYIEDPIHDGFMRKESIKVPSGCDCRIPETDPSNNKSVRTFFEREKYSDKDFLNLDDNIVTNIPTLLEPEDHSHLMGRNRSTLNHTSAGSNWLQYSNYSHLDLHGGSSHKTNQQTSYTRDREQHFTDIKQNAVPTQNQSMHVSHLPGFSHHISHSTYEGPNIGAPKSQDNADQRALNDKYFSDPDSFETTPTRQVPIQTVRNDPYAALNPVVPQDRLRALNNLVASPTLQPVNPQLVSNLNDLNSLMSNYIKMGMISPNPRAMSTTQIVENALTKVHSSQQMQALAMAERLMLLEIEHLRLSLSMAEMSFKQFDNNAQSNVPNLSFANEPSRENIPVIFQPGGLKGPMPVIFDSNKASTFTSTSSTIPSLQGSGAAKPLSFGNPPVRGDLPVLTHNSTPPTIETSSLRPETPPRMETPSSKAESSSVKLEILSKKELPSSGDLAKLAENTPPRNTSRSSVIQDMLEEELYAAFADYLFQEAWMNSSCRVPVAINGYQSELNFLPEIIKEKLDIRVVGTVDIHKFAARIIAGTITCRVQNLEAALLDGSLARVITGGIKVAEVLNNHIKIIRGVMRGLLDTDQAKGLVNILKWASQSTGSPSAEGLVSSSDSADIENTLSLVDKALKVYIDVFGSSIKASLNEKKDFSSSTSLIQAVSVATEASSLKKNPVGPFRNLAIQPPDNSMVGLNPTAVILTALNGNRSIFNLPATPVTSTKTTLSEFTIGSSVTAGFGAVMRPGHNPIVATSFITITTVVTHIPMTSTTSTSTGMNMTTTIVRGSTVPSPALSSTISQIMRNRTMLGGSGIVTATPSPNAVISWYDKSTTSEVDFIPLVNDGSDVYGGDFYDLNKTVIHGKPTPTDTDETKVIYDPDDIDKWVPGYGDDNFVDKTNEKSNNNNLVSSSKNNIMFGSGPGEYEELVENLPIDMSLLPSAEPKKPHVIGHLPKEYDPLDIAPGSLMNLLFPNLR